ncbi:hypothetical protein DEO72_LG1g1947 [Vigna unguiculata]|uniref:Uncharacterized protein n=1 Tax=Vigna unguiculata TaxID=3917 RepID=A0A4D6KP19_VIGUN|nr:hypothetical protein DEO72_LG1g1947 [Vigna unguiculata]
MATSTIKLFTTILFFVFFSQGYSKCSLKDIHVSQAITGLTVKGKPEMNVTIANWCSCAQSNLKLDCRGFQSTKAINPSILNVSGNVCLVNGGKPLLKV